MTYVDLNPIRAGMTEALENSAHASVAERIARAAMDPSRLPEPLKPIAGNLRPSFALTTADYLQILDWTGRQLAPGKRGRIANEAPAILAVIDRDSRRWETRVRAFGSGWHRAAGSA